MLYLQEVFDKLAYTKLNNMSVGKSVTSSIKEQDYHRVVSLLNSALYDIYTRLVLKKKEFDLYQRSGYTTYYLRPDNIGNVNSGDPDVYIDGTCNDPIDGDIINLLEAYDEDGNEVYLNDGRHTDDLFTLAYDTLTITERDPLAVISVVYQASHPLITIDSTFDPETYELYFPRFAMNAVLNYVAAEWFTSKTAHATEGQPSLGTTFRYQYEAAIAQIEDKFLASTVDKEKEQFVNNGWV